MEKLNVEELYGVKALVALRDEWRNLARAAQATPFLSWEWVSAQQRWLAREQMPYLLCARAGDRLVGLLPLGLSEQRSPAGARRMTLLGDGFAAADYLDVLALPEYAQEARAALCAHLAEHTPFDFLELHDLAADSPTLPFLKQSCGSSLRLKYQVQRRFVCPQIELSEGWPVILKYSKRRDNFKQRLRQMQARAGFEYRTVTEPSEALAAFARFYKLHEARWAAQGGSEATSHEALRAFHCDAVLRLAAAGAVRFEELWAEGECRASFYTLVDQKTVYLYNSGYDLNWRHASPGLVLLGLSIADAARRGLRRYDFLRGAEDYKFAWANATSTTVSVLVARRNLAGRLCQAQVRAERGLSVTAQTLLPERATELLRQWRRSSRRQAALAEAV